MGTHLWSLKSNLQISPWDDDQHDATDIARTSLTQNPGLTEVSQTPRSGFSISVTNELTSWPFQSISSWSPTSTNRSDPKLWKPLELVPTNTWSRCPVKTLTICESEPILTTSPESTKC